MATTPEGKVKDKAKALFKKYGAEYDRNAITGMGQNGRADDIVCRAGDGHFGGVEYKAGNKFVVSALQRIWLEARAKIGGSTMVVNETNLEMLERWLQRPGTRLVAEFEGNKCVRHWAYVPGYPPHEVKNPTPTKGVRKSHRAIGA